MGSGVLKDSAATAHLAGGIGIARWPAKRQRGDTHRLSNHGTALERQRRWDSETATAARQLGDCAQQRRWRRWDSGDVLGSRHAIARITGVRHWDGRNCDARAAVTPKDRLWRCRGPPSVPVFNGDVGGIKGKNEEVKTLV
jgi:hypothetical protein